MKKAIEFFKKNKKTFAIVVLLILLIIIAVFTFSDTNSIIQTGSYNSDNSSVQQRSETETKLMRILSEIDGVGKAEVMINEGADGVKGVIIVCEGANSLMTRNDVINAVTVALNVNKAEIAIYAMK